MKKEQKVIKVRPGERVSCPTKYHENWNLHPRVYIDLKDKKLIVVLTVERLLK